MIAISTHCAPESWSEFKTTKIWKSPKSRLLQVQFLNGKNVQKFPELSKTSINVKNIWKHLKTFYSDIQMPINKHKILPFSNWTCPVFRSCLWKFTEKFWFEMCFFFNCHQVGSCRRVSDVGWGWWSHNHVWRHVWRHEIVVVVKSGSVTRFWGRLWRARAWVVWLVRDWVETGEEVSVQVRRPATLHGGDTLLSNEIINKVVWQSGAFFNFSIFVIPTFFKSFTNSPLSYLLCKRIAEELHSFISCQHFYCYFCCCVSKHFF